MEKGTFTDPRDGKEYRTVKIGEQVWMAENFAYEAEGSKCYKNNSVYCAKYGRLYDWETAKKACPPDWHLPSNAEWQELVNFAGGNEIAGKKLKATNGWNSCYGQSGNGTDDYDFAALPGGAGSNLTIGNNGMWWSASEHNGIRAYSQNIGHDGDLAILDHYTKFNLFSVRCVQD